MKLVPATQKSEFQFDLSGGHLALDLANTVSRRDDPGRRRDHLEGYPEFVSFLRQSKSISTKQANELHGDARGHSLEARRSFAKIIKLREAIYRVFAAIAQRKAVPASDLKTINDFAIEALRHRALAPRNGGYSWEWIADHKNPFERFLWPMAQAATDLLTSDELKMLRFCEAPDCEWLFLDRSRNRSRRWCDMTSCGNRAKARRHYERAHR
jgi:predicted RNA-binding Zn ribbon-like protein